MRTIENTTDPVGQTHAPIGTLWFDATSPVMQVNRVPALVRGTIDAPGRNTCALMLEAMREVRAVATTQGAELDAEALEGILLSTPDNFRTSMQKDLSAGRALELDAIAGPIVRVGREHEIPTPATLELVRRVAAAQAL